MKRFLLFYSVIFFFACGNDAAQQNNSVAAEGIPDNKPAHAMPDNAAPQVREVLKDAAESKEEKPEESEPVIEKEPDASVEKTEEKIVEETKNRSATDKKTEPKKIRKYSEITFESSRWNFGDIKDGDVVSHDFKFKNTGTSPLEIRNVTASCGCTQPSFPFMPIAPGEEGVISVTFNSTGKINEQRPTVTVTSNAKPAITKLYLEGMVRPK